MGKDNNLVERQTFSSEFHLPKRRSIIIYTGSGSHPSLFLSLSLYLFFRGGERRLRPPLDPPLLIIRAFRISGHLETFIKKIASI